VTDADVLREVNRARFARLRWWQVRLDEAFRVPGTPIRFGWDAILGIVPGTGDLVGVLFGLTVLWHAHRMRVPRVVQARMFVNLAVDVALGVVPLAGDVADVFWKANTRNLALLERHVAPERPATRGDWVFVSVVAATLAFLAMMPVLAALWLGRILGSW
jgi:hypothetical protein